MVSSTPGNAVNFSSLLCAAVPSEVSLIGRVLSQAGFRAWAVGGCVRDTIGSALLPDFDRSVSDWDLCTDADPAQVSRLFRKVIPTGIEHGTVTVVLSRQHFEVTTLRGEKGHTDGRRPDEVYFVSDLNDDLARRDFTVNAMAFELSEEKFADPFCGVDDLRSRTLRAVGDPERRFAEDGLRVLRCARFGATLGFNIEERTRAAIAPSLGSFKKVAGERVRDEWFKALRSPAPSRFLQVIHAEKMLSVTAPGLFADRNAGFAAFDESPAEPVLRLALCCLLGSGKGEAPLTHAKRLSKTLRLSREQSAELSRLCEYGRLPPPLLQDPSPGSFRHYIASVGADAIDSVLSVQLHRQRAEAAFKPQSEAQKSDTRKSDESAQARLDDLRRAHSAISEQVAAGHPFSLRDLAVSGADLIEAGVPPGPALGQTLRALLQEVLDDPALNAKATLLERAKSTMSSSA